MKQPNRTQEPWKQQLHVDLEEKIMKKGMN